MLTPQDIKRRISKILDPHADRGSIYLVVHDRWCMHCEARTHGNPDDNGATEICLECGCLWRYKDGEFLANLVAEQCPILAKAS